MTNEHKDTPLDWILHDIFAREEMHEADYLQAEADLEAFIELELEGLDAHTSYPHMRPALARYADLREQYETLYALLANQRAGLLVETSGALDFDLSFLKERQSLWEPAAAGQKQVSRLLRQISIRISRKVSTFGQLPAGLRSQLIAVPLRDAAGEQATAEALDIQSSDPEVSFRIQLGPAQENLAIVSLQFKHSGSGPPISRARASLLGDTGRILVSTRVDDAGWITFRDIAPGPYTVRISEAEMIWELPLIVSDEDDKVTTSEV